MCRDLVHASPDSGDSKPNTETEVSSKKRRVEKNVAVIPRKDHADVSVSDNTQNCDPIATHNGSLGNDPKKEKATSDTRRIVQRTNRRHSKHVKCPNSDDKSSMDQETMAGLRVKKIMKRASEDKESTMVVQNLREEIREAVRDKASKDFGENLFDPKLLAAFRAAVAGPKTEPVKTFSHLAVKARKAMLQKGKVRDNLTKKIYASSNGRRKRAWDRDCEIEFWKHRCTGASKPEKIQTLKSVLDLLRNESKGTETEQSSERQSTNPILSRLYLADTSVFPRKDDIKPLSALKSCSDSVLKSKQPTLAEKCSNSSLDNHTSSSTQTNKVSSKVGISSSETSGKRKTIPGLKDNAASSKVQLSKTNAQKETAIKSSDIKSDKRKWALEVLARKTIGNASNEKQEDTTVLKGNYPLLVRNELLSKDCFLHNYCVLQVMFAYLWCL